MDMTIWEMFVIFIQARIVGKYYVIFLFEKGLIKTINSYNYKQELSEDNDNEVRRNEKFNKNAKVEKFTKQLGRGVCLIVKGPYYMVLSRIIFCTFTQGWYTVFQYSFNFS